MQLRYERSPLYWEFDEVAHRRAKNDCGPILSTSISDKFSAIDLLFRPSYRDRRVRP